MKQRDIADGPTISRTRRHDIAHRFDWARPDEALLAPDACVYDNNTGTVRHSIPKETGFQRNYYSVPGEEEGQYDDSIEQWLSGVETKAARPYETLLSGEIPQDQARADFAVYLSSQYARSPTTRRMYAEVHASGAHAIMKVITETPERFESQLRQFEAKEGPIEKHIRDRLYDFSRDTSRYDLVVSREATLSALLVSDKLLKLFSKMGWQCR